MGDRGNIVVIDDRGKGIWLYSHWGGYRLEQTARKAVERSGRIGDPSYLTRIIFCDMVADTFGGESGRGFNDPTVTAEELVGEFASTLGAGIGTQGAGDQEYPTVCVDAMTGEIWTDPTRPTKTSEVLANRPAYQPKKVWA